MPVITPKIPEGLPELMRGLAKSVIKENPNNIYEYAADYFDNLIKNRDGGELDKSYKAFTAYRVYADYKRKTKEKTVKHKKDHTNVESRDALESVLEEKSTLALPDLNISKFDIKSPERSRQNSAKTQSDIKLLVISEEYEKLDEVVAAVTKIQTFYRKYKINKNKDENNEDLILKDKETGEENENVHPIDQNKIIIESTTKSAHKAIDIETTNTSPSKSIQNAYQNVIVDEILNKSADQTNKNDKKFNNVEGLDIDLYDSELNVAAKKIQKTFRGHKNRKINTSSYIEAEKADDTVSAVELDYAVITTEELNIDTTLLSAVILIQKYVRGYIARKKLKPSELQNSVSSRFSDEIQNIQSGNDTSNTTETKSEAPTESDKAATVELTTALLSEPVLMEAELENLNAEVQNDSQKNNANVNQPGECNATTTNEPVEEELFQKEMVLGSNADVVPTENTITQHLLNSKDSILTTDNDTNNNSNSADKLKFDDVFHNLESIKEDKAQAITTVSILSNLIENERPEENNNENMLLRTEEALLHNTIGDLADVVHVDQAEENLPEKVIYNVLNDEDKNKLSSNSEEELVQLEKNSNKNIENNAESTNIEPVESIIIHFKDNNDTSENVIDEVSINYNNSNEIIADDCDEEIKTETNNSMDVRNAKNYFTDNVKSIDLAVQDERNLSLVNVKEETIPNTIGDNSTAEEQHNVKPKENDESPKTTSIDNEVIEEDITVNSDQISPENKINVHTALLVDNNNDINESDPHLSATVRMDDIIETYKDNVAKVDLCVYENSFITQSESLSDEHSLSNNKIISSIIEFNSIEKESDNTTAVVAAVHEQTEYEDEYSEITNSSIADKNEINLENDVHDDKDFASEDVPFSISEYIITENSAELMVSTDENIVEENVDNIKVKSINVVKLAFTNPIEESEKSNNTEVNCLEIVEVTEKTILDNIEKSFSVDDSIHKQIEDVKITDNLEVLNDSIEPVQEVMEFSKIKENTSEIGTDDKPAEAIIISNNTENKSNTSVDKLSTENYNSESTIQQALTLEESNTGSIVKNEIISTVEPSTILAQVYDPSEKVAVENVLEFTGDESNSINEILSADIVLADKLNSQTERTNSADSSKSKTILKPNEETANEQSQTKDETSTTECILDGIDTVDSSFIRENKNEADSERAQISKSSDDGISDENSSSSKNTKLIEKMESESSNEIKDDMTLKENANHNQNIPKKHISTNKYNQQEISIDDQLAKIEKIDNTLKNQNSAEALFYSLKKTELLVEQQQSRISSLSLNELVVVAEEGSNAADSENDNDDVIINSLNDENAETTKNLENQQYNPFVEAALKNESYLQQIHGEKLENISPKRRSLMKSYTAAPVFSKEIEDEDQFDDYFVGNIRQKMLAYSISRADSDYFDPNKAIFTNDDNNIKTTLETILSTDSDSTIVSAVTKIQAGARGFLTRRRLQSSTGTINAVQVSFGNAAIDQSLDDFVEQVEQIQDKTLEDAAMVIQRSYRNFKAIKDVAYGSVSNDSNEEYNYPGGVIEIKLEQKKLDLNADTGDGNELKFVRPQTLEADKTLLNVEEFDAATRRSMLHRENAVQRNSTPDDDSGVSQNVSTEKKSSTSSGEKSFDNNISENSEITSKSKDNSSEIKRLSPVVNKLSDKWKLGTRQRTMPVQIDSTIIRFLPKHLRKRIRSAENNRKF